MSTDATVATTPTSNKPLEEPGPFGRTILWYHRHFLTHFCYYLTLPLVLLFLVLMMSGKFGRDFGVTDLVLHDDPIRQAVVGLSMAIVWLQVLFVAYLIWLRDRREGWLGDDVRPAEPPPFGGWGYAAWM